MSIRPSEYGSRGLVGIGVPQANPTVEQELFALRPAGLSIVTSRLVSAEADPAARLIEYFERTVDYAAQFDDLSIDVFGIACTGSSYLLGQQREQELLAGFEAKLGYPVLSAAGAIRSCLHALGAKRISIVSPYPGWLAERAREYWTGCGFEIAAQSEVSLSGPNIHSIYALRSGDALQIARNLEATASDAILFTGTGMATLGAIAPLQASSGRPVLSSNLCLLSALARHTGALDGAVLPVPAGLDTGAL